MDRKSSLKFLESEHQQGEILEIFKYLAAIPDRKKKKIPKIEFWQNIAPEICQRRFFIGGIFFFSMAMTWKMTSPNSNIPLLLVLIGLLFFTLWITSILYWQIKTSKSNRQIRQEQYIKAGIEADNDHKEAKNLAVKHEKEKLERAYKKFKSSIIEESKGRKQVVSKFSPILVFIWILLSVYILGISPQDIEQAWPLFSGVLGLGLVSFLTTILTWFSEASWHSQNIENNRRLCILENAINIADKIEAYQNDNHTKLHSGMLSEGTETEIQMSSGQEKITSMNATQYQPDLRSIADRQTN